MRETLGVLLGFFLAAVLGYLISEIAQKEQEKEVLESYMDSLQEIYEVIRQRMDVTRCGSADRNISENPERNLLPG